MRRNSRRHNSEEKSKNILYIGGSILAIGIISFAITFVVYGNKMEKQSKINTSKIAEIVQNTNANNQAQTASTQMGKTVEESSNQINNNTNNNKVKNNTNTINTNITKEENNINSNKPKETKKETLTFIKPVDGEKSKDFAKDNLIYSETLQEWTTHLGVDIKADKTTVVKACANGKVKSIKNDPRYGLSVIIEHQEGYETLYANLLTTEFVEVGEEVKQGDSIATVGNSAAFEITDAPHLHFEISKNGDTLDPNQFIK